MEAVKKRVVDLENLGDNLISTTLPNSVTKLQFLPGTISEFVGLPGVGKTQLCYKMMIEHLLSSDDFHVFFISTTGSFSPERCVELIRQYRDNSHLIHSLMERIKSIDVVEIVEMFGMLHAIEKYLSTFKVSLLILDGTFVPFKDTTSNAPLIKFLSSLKKLAYEHQFAVIFTTNFTRKFCNNQAVYVPYLGHIYSLYIDVRVKLSRDCEGKLRAKIDNDL